jgi:hypothetical protein
LRKQGKDLAQCWDRQGQGFHGQAGLVWLSSPISNERRNTGFLNNFLRCEAQRKQGVMKHKSHHHSNIEEWNKELEEWLKQ